MACLPGQRTAGIPSTVVSSGFFADPFSNYNSFIADTTFAGTNGTVTTVSWNNSTLTAPTYSTPQAAVNAAAAVNGGGGQRVCNLTGQTWSLATQTPILIPALTGTSATNRFVIQGDPAATANTMPIWTGNGTEGYGLILGGAPPFTGAAARNVSNTHVTLRKVEITNFVAVSNSVGAINLTQNNYNDFVAEFCKLHLFRQVVGPGGGGPVYTNTPNDTAIFEIRYCKMYDNLMTDGTTQGRPFAAVETYGGQFNIHHNEGYAVNTFYAGKVLTPSSPNGNITKNLIHDIPDMIEFEAGGEGPGINVIVVNGNLFYWTHFNDAVFGTPGNATVYNDFGANGNTTAPTGMQFYSNTVDAAIGNSGNPAFWNHTTTAVQSHDNIILGTTPLMVQSGGAGTWTFIDRNFYFNPVTFYLNGSGSPASVGSFTAWQSAHTTFPTFGGLTANPDANGGNIGAFTAPFNTIAANFPNTASFDYTIAASSPLKGAGAGGSDPGYNPSDVGPGW